MGSNLRMFISKYKRPLIILLAYYVLLLCLSYYVRSNNLFDDPIYLTPFVPSTDMYVQVNLILLVFVPVSALIGGLFGGYFVAPIFLFFHKKILGSRYYYCIQERPKSQTFGIMNRGYFPALLTININSILLFSVPGVINQILIKNFWNVQSLIVQFIQIITYLDF